MGKQGKKLRKKIALPPQHPDNSPSLQGDERAATYSCTPIGREGQKSVQLDVRFSQGQQQGVSMMDRVTFLFFFPTHVHKKYSGCKGKN